MGYPASDSGCAAARIKRSFDEKVAELAAPLADLAAACTALAGALGLRAVLGMVLALGNYMNGGTGRGQADGFMITDLAQIVEAPTSWRICATSSHALRQLGAVGPEVATDGGDDHLLRIVPNASECRAAVAAAVAAGAAWPRRREARRRRSRTADRGTP